MASLLDLSGLVLNPKENPDLAAFIFEQVFLKPELMRLHGIQTGVTMQEQIVFAAQLGKTGVKAGADCTRGASGASTSLSQKYWNPKGIEDLLVHCNKEMNALFKAYFDKISKYSETYDIEGSDTEMFIAKFIETSMANTIWRAAWYGDTAVAQAAAGTAGLVLAADVKFYDYFDGLWKQIFAGVTATTISRFTITKNALTVPADQLALASGESITIFEGIWANADARLRSNQDKKIYVSHQIFENYRQYLQGKGENFTIDYTMQGFPMLMWNSVEIVDMETVWDTEPFVDFVQDTTNNALYLPNRAVMTVPANIPIGTLNENDFSELDTWFDKDLRTNKFSYGFSLDAKVLEEYMISVAY